MTHIHSQLQSRILNHFHFSNLLILAANENLFYSWKCELTHESKNIFYHGISINPQLTIRHCVPFRHFHATRDAKQLRELWKFIKGIIVTEKLLVFVILLLPFAFCAFQWIDSFSCCTERRFIHMKLRWRERSSHNWHSSTQLDFVAKRAFTNYAERS